MSRFPVYSTLGPRQIKWVVQDEAQWMITLDSGFIDNIPEYGYTGSRTGAQLAAGTGNSPPISVSAALRAQLQNNMLLGEAAFSIEDGKAADGVTLERLFLNGGRGISIREGGTLNVATSLVDNIERVSSQAFTTIFNSGYRVPTNTPQQDKEATSPTFGPDLSVIETGLFNGQKVLFLGSANSGIIYVYVLVPSADCPQPYWHSAVRSGNTFATWNTAYANSQMGDIGITDMLFIPRQGQRTVDVLIVASSTSNSISSYRISDI